MKRTFKVASLFDCNYTIGYETLYKPNPIWRQTLIGCKVLKIIQDLYHFNISYIYRDSNWYADDKRMEGINESTPDVYATPMALTTEILDYAYPVHPIIQRRFGFILYRSPQYIFTWYYNQPFTKAVWYCLLAMAFVTVLLFYMLRCWEKRLIARNGECTLTYEILVVFGGLCQHILPIKPILTSRRIAYVTFLLSSYVIYSFYTSNLLSHLVSDRDKAMTLEELVDRDYELVVLENTKLNIETINHCRNTAILQDKMTRMKKMNASAGLEAVRSGTTAIFSDFITLYPYMRKSFDEQLVCDLVEIDVYSNIKLYLFISKHFPEMEEAKIALLRAKETGLLKQVMTDPGFAPQRCSLPFPPHTHYTYFLHIVDPLSLLIATYVLATLIMMAERVHFQRNRLWPYVN